MKRNFLSIILVLFVIFSVIFSVYPRICFSIFFFLSPWLGIFYHFLSSFLSSPSRFRLPRLFSLLSILFSSFLIISRLLYGPTSFTVAFLIFILLWILPVLLVVGGENENA